jgi:hypothetical protein
MQWLITRFPFPIWMRKVPVAKILTISYEKTISLVSHMKCSPLKLDCRMIQGLQTGGSMGRKPRVDRSPEEKWQIVQEGMKSGNVSEVGDMESLRRSTTVGKAKQNTFLLKGL